MRRCCWRQTFQTRGNGWPAGMVLLSRQSCCPALGHLAAKSTPAVQHSPTPCNGCHALQTAGVFECGSLALQAKRSVPLVGPLEIFFWLQAVSLPGPHPLSPTALPRILCTTQAKLILNETRHASHRGAALLMGGNMCSYR